ncbi:MAG: GNAT family N-acetyltransferase [Promethearchaeota archaeon]
MPFTIKRPAYRIETERTVIRCYHPRDAPLLEQGVQESLEHLKPWMPWAHSNPEPMEMKVNRLRLFRSRFDMEEEYIFGIFNPEETRLIGGTGFHPRGGPQAIEIGYWIHVDYINKGYGTEITGALTKIALEIYKFNRVEIQCDPLNLASASIPRKLNYVHEATLKGRALDERGNLRDSMIWSITSEEYADSIAKSQEIKAFDVVGKPISFA